MHLTSYLKHNKPLRPPVCASAQMNLPNSFSVQMSVHTEGKTVCVLYYCDALYRPTRINHYLNITGSDTQHFKILMLTIHLGSGPRDFKPGIKIAGEQALLGYYLMKQQFKMSDFSPNFGGIWTGLLYISDVHRGHILHVSKQFDTLQSSFAF